ncbi:MAG TPA: DNA gyrase inhibitor YacG [Aliidiomarina sp.]|nr:DNA gyrase inhibitor YacG [Aliidiomarina sp.]
MTKAVTTVKCPTCQATVKWEPASEFRPFCSDRCKLIDLGEWANEEKRIPGEELPPTANESSDEWDY